MDITVFRLLNGLAGRSVVLDGAIIFCASGLVFAMLAVVIGYVVDAWKTTHLEGRVENLTHAAWAAAIGFVFQLVIGFFWFRPRPFVALDHVIKLVDRLPVEKSFPSAHATFAFALAFAVSFHNKKWGRVLLVMAVLVSLGRVAAGVHYPTDVLGGLAVGFIAAKLAAPVKKGVEPYLEFLPLFRKYKRRDV